MRACAHDWVVAHVSLASLVSLALRVYVCSESMCTCVDAVCLPVRNLMQVRMGSPPKNDWAGMQGNGEADADIETSRGAWGSAGVCSYAHL